MATETSAGTCTHKADPNDPQFCRLCGEPMPGAENAIAGAFADAPAVQAAPDAGTGLKCIRPGCEQELAVGAACCEACGLPITWNGSVPHQELPAPPTPAAPVATATSLTPAGASPGAPPQTGYVKVVVRPNLGIHDRTQHPNYDTPYDSAPLRGYEVHGPRAQIGRALGSEPHDSNPLLILAYDGAVSEAHATLERLDSGSWEVRDHSTNGTRLNHARLPRQSAGDPVGSGVPIKVGDLLWLGYYTEIEIEALA